MSSGSKFLKTYPKVKFDTDSREHISIYAEFIKNGRSWKNGCPFMCVEPFESVPHMIESMVTAKVCQLVEDGIM